METNEQDNKEELKEEKIVADEAPQEEVTEETKTVLTNEEKLQQEVENKKTNWECVFFKI